MQAVISMPRDADWERVMLGVLEACPRVSGRQVRALDKLGRVFRVMRIPAPLSSPRQAVDGTLRFEWAAAGGGVSSLVIRLDGGRYYQVVRGGGYRNHIRAAGGNGPRERKLCAALRMQLLAERAA